MSPVLKDQAMIQLATPLGVEREGSGPDTAQQIKSDFRGKPLPGHEEVYVAGCQCMGSISLCDKCMVQDARRTVQMLASLLHECLFCAPMTPPVLCLSHITEQTIK